MHTMKSFTIGPDCSMPALGFGTWKVDTDLTSSAVLSALDAGCMHIECAPIYGNEARVGAALNHLLDVLPAMRRKQWITSKLWNADHRPGWVRRACLKTLRALQLSHLDFFLIRWPVQFREGVSWPETLAAASLELDAADLARLDGIDTRQRYVSPSGWFMPGSPISEQQLWRESAPAVVSQQALV
jgi:diketogulonate reductase-like aldo/keto reductase